MSEPDTGSDLASVRTCAVREAGGWRVNGTKLSTTDAHHCHSMILFCRTGPVDPERHAGTSQFLVDLALPGLTIRPVRNLTGEHHLSEVVFEDARRPEDAILGREEDGWAQASRDFERVLAYTTMHAPSFSLRGGTREILRGIIDRGLGLR